ncbi:HMG domain-containing protein 3 [Genypterus blacodes]|uniref:HMG domain-containing protein 3 n=1 Tax=Genypterus blacodes TaxID=154954 RepID=UPI003F76C9AD
METMETMETMESVDVYDDVKGKVKVESCGTFMEVTSPKKRKSKTQEDGMEKPKKPRSAYLLYYFDVHQLMQQEIPNLPQSEINKRISESWKRLSVAEKAYYLEKAKAEKEGTDTSSSSPPDDLPGFRKILPRTTYVVLSKSCSSSEQTGGLQSDLSVGSLGSPGEGGTSSLSKEPQFSPLGLASEVELAEESIIVEDLEEETAVTSHLQGILLSSTSAISSKDPPSTVIPMITHDLQSSSDLTADGMNHAFVEGDVGRAMVQLQGEKTQLVTIIPAQKPMAVVSSVGQVMMVSVGGSIEQSAKPSNKRSVKTYTRRGRGRCPTPSCSFVYVTRHKPPTCPDCGSHLGGKWMPAAKKKKKEKDEASKRVPQKAQNNCEESCQAALSPAGEMRAAGAVSNSPRSKKDEQVQRRATKKQALTAGAPLEGSSTKLQTQTKSERGAATPDRSGGTEQKKPVRPILPAFYSTAHPLLQFITVPSDGGKLQNAVNIKPAIAPREKLSALSGLKPNTLKQLGHPVPAAAAKQDSSSSQQVASMIDKGVNYLSVVPLKQNTVSSFNLGLSTARGRGRCKNPSCDYVYKNRHKPAMCPKCGSELSQKSAKGTKSGALLDPYQALSPAQKEVQRQSTLQLLRRSLEIPETETELQETLTLIEELNRLQIVWIQPADQNTESSAEMKTETLIESGWPQFYESAATHCGLCGCPLFKGDQSTVAGQEDCWLLTETLIQTASLQLKVCLNAQCLALHSFTDLHPGLFNVGNRLLVSIDLFLKIRANIRLGHSPSQAVRTILDHIPNHPVHALSPEESSQIQELLLSGYWAFECLTVRDYNDMICGVCGIVPKVEIAQRNTHNVLELKNVEFTWPEFSVSDEVHVDDFWLTMESEAIEQAAFPADIPITRVDASIIAPFIPPLMRSPTVINTEKDKDLSHTQQPSGDPSALVRLIHEGELRLDRIEEHSEEELRTILERCGASFTHGSDKNELLASLVSFYTLVHTGVSTAPQPPPQRTAGKLSKVCPHKVVCGSKYMVRGETARDHIDLLVSSRYWPPVYVTDCARQVALCTDMQYPELATQMWGRNQGCFSDPFEKPEFVSCAELQEQPYDAELFSVRENQQVHPITKSPSCWLVHPAEAADGQELPAPDHHSMVLCRDLEPYVSLVAELEQKNKKDEEEQSDATEESEVSSSVSRAQSGHVVFNNAAYYYLYNRLVDFLSSRDVVNQQINEVVKACQPGQVVIRDALYRLGVAQINTEREEDEDTGVEGQEQDGGTETTDEVVLL